MSKEFNKNSNKDFQNPNMDPPVEFSMDNYDKAVQDPEYVRRITEPVVETPTAPSSNPEPEIKQEPVEERPVEEEPITEIPQDEPAQKQPRKSREEKNLESELNGPKWQGTKNHGRRLRYRNNFLEEEEGPGHEWDSENWDNIHHIEDQDPKETKDNRD